MIAKHRETITSNLGVLVDGTDLDELLPKLVEKGVFLEEMVSKYQNCKGGTEKNLKRDLYLNVLTRGPEAFNNLISALHDSGHYSLAVALEPGSPMATLPSQSKIHPYILPEYLLGVPNTLKQMKEYAESHPDSQVNLSTLPKTINVKKSTKKMDCSSVYKTQIYVTGSKPKGHALIININKYNKGVKKEIVGAEHDVKNLEVLFKGLGYKVTVQKNLKGQEMLKKLKNFAKDKGHLHYDSCILAILSHGVQIGDESHFVAADGENVGVNSVLELFSNENCGALQKKPKIFLFHCCRGDKNAHGIGEFTRTKKDGTGSVPLRTYSDMLIAYSTVNGLHSPRDSPNGSRFIQAICEVFMEHACDTEIMEMLKLVDDKVETSAQGTKQTSCFENRGFKTFFFNPGIYDDNVND